MPLDLFCSLSHAIRSIDGTINGVVDIALGKIGRSRSVVLAVPHFHSLASIVATSDLVAAAPAEFARLVGDDMGLAVYELPLEIPAPEMWLYWHRRHDGTPAQVWLRQRVMDAAEVWT